MKPKRKSYMLYFKCGACGYSVNISVRWAAIGTPRCLNPECANKTQLLTEQKPVAQAELSPANMASPRNAEKNPRDAGLM